MARNQIWDMKYEELEQKTNEYKELFGDKPHCRPSWAHYASWLGTDEKKLEEVSDLGRVVTSAYYKHSQLLIKISTWIRGQISSSPGWAKATATEKNFLLSQRMGDNNPYVNNSTGSKKSGKKDINIRFGGSDKRGSSAFD